MQQQQQSNPMNPQYRNGPNHQVHEGQTQGNTAGKFVQLRMIYV